MDTSWMQNRALKDIDPAKLQMLLSLSEQGKTKNQKELLPFLLAAANNSKHNGLTFSSSETDAIIEVMKIGKSPQEIQKIEKLRQLMTVFLSKR